MSQYVNVPNELTLQADAVSLVEKKLNCVAEAIKVEYGQVWVKCMHHTTAELLDTVLVYFNRQTCGYWFCFNGKFYFS